MLWGIVLRFAVPYFKRMTSFSFVIALFLSPFYAKAQTAQLLETPRFTLYFPTTASASSQPKPKKDVDDLAQNSLTILNTTYEHLKETFGIEPQTKVVLRFMTPKEFHKHTRAPTWTSAMFLRGEISIPLTSMKNVNMRELTRAIRHEYVHAVVAELSSKNCPAWIDEGLAQLFEGEINPLLGPSLRDWISENDALPMSWLQNGFLSLNEKLVPVAYAQSLFATRSLLRSNGFPSFKRYLDELGRGMPDDDAFTSACGISPRVFERQLTADIREWARSNRPHP